MTEPNRAARRAAKTVDTPIGKAALLDRQSETPEPRKPVGLPVEVQTFIVADGIDVETKRMPTGEEVRQLVIPTLGGAHVFVIPVTVAYANDLARRLMRGDELEVLS